MTDDKPAAKADATPVLLAGGNPQIAKADGDAPVQAYIAAMPGWKRDVGRSLDALIVRTVPNVQKAVRWNSPFYGVEGQGWFLNVPLLHQVRQSRVLPRHVTAPSPSRRIQDEGHALPRHPRERRARPGAHGELDQASSGATRLGPVASGREQHLFHRLARDLSPDANHLPIQGEENDGCGLGRPFPKPASRLVEPGSELSGLTTAVL